VVAVSVVAVVELDEPTRCDRVGCTTPATLAVHYVGGAYSYNCIEHARERAPVLVDAIVTVVPDVGERPS
jgi:hypothetical protein